MMDALLSVVRYLHSFLLDSKPTAAKWGCSSDLQGVSSLAAERCRLQNLLETAARLRPSRRLIFYSHGDIAKPVEVEYGSLYKQAKANSQIIRSLRGFEEGAPILLHLDDQWDTILWLWSVLLANGLPVLSSSFSNVPEHRRKHIQGLSALLESPICITRNKLLHLFDGSHSFRLHMIESLLENAPSCNSILMHGNERHNEHSDTVAMLMLTSGSTGNAKAVQLSHKQIFAAIAGKACVRQLPSDKPFLNWIGLDHVASMIEIHLQAMYLGVDQIHVHTSDIVSSPALFLDLLSHHQVSRSFAPNFFLAKLVSTVHQSEVSLTNNGKWDLRYLTILASGGEANDILTCKAATALLAKHGAPQNVITTGFGMTETCAGAIFNLNCPEYDIQNENAFASLGKCMKGIEMRVTVPTDDGSVSIAPYNQPGDLEVRGEVVFKGYYRNEKATTEAFTSDGWFRTGDQAILDSQGNLNLIGRTKEVMNVNGVNISCADVQAWLDQTLGQRVSRSICFPTRAPGAHTEQITVAYVPKESPMPVEDALDIHNTTMEACITCTGSRPLVFSLPHESLLPTTTLGKISRAKMRSLFEGGMFEEHIKAYDQVIDDYRATNLSPPTNKAESDLLDDFAAILDITSYAIGIDTPVYDMGFTSMDLIRLKHRIDSRLSINVPVITLMKNPTVRLLASALHDLECSDVSALMETDQSVVEYDPVVPLRPGGSKTPLWLIHPGVGEVLVFVGLAQHLADDDRPVYALRARGFEAGQTPFTSMAEAVEAYLKAIRQRQPKGPYALAGYSYGTVLAFEVAKRLEREDGATVQFLGSFNLPPHIKKRMRQLSWNLCLLHLAYFLGLVTEQYANNIEDAFTSITKEEAMAQIFTVADKTRMAELGLTEEGLARWASLAYGLQSMAVDYEPRGNVTSIDVFHAIPLKGAAESREDWVENHLRRWEDFSRTEPRFHEVGGAHYTMIGPDHVMEFSKTLTAALRARGL